MNTLSKYMFIFLVPCSIIYYSTITLHAQSTTYSAILNILGCILLVYTSVSVAIILQYKKQTHSATPTNVAKTTVDIYLPICGEEISILQRTWLAVSKLSKYSKLLGIEVEIFVLDDTTKPVKRIQHLARSFSFNYIRRENIGEFKKAGNINYAFQKTNGEFILILDADFAPKKEFLIETITVLLNDSNIAILQTPQAFDVKNVSLFEFGTSVIQDFFYQVVQNAFNNLGACICVGTNAVYRRSALEKIGGVALIGHSEYVWTGFKLSALGQRVVYFDKPLAFGRSPETLISYFKQQMRWCQGSLSLMTNKEFWTSKLPWYSKLSFISKFMYYLSSPLILLYSLLSVGINTSTAENTTISSLMLYTAIINFGIFFTLIQKRFKPIVFVVFMVNIFVYSFTVVSYFLKLESVWVPSGASHKRNKEFMRFYRFFIAYLVTYFILVLLKIMENVNTNTIGLFWQFVNSSILLSILYYIHMDQISILFKEIARIKSSIIALLPKLTLASLRSLF